MGPHERDHLFFSCNDVEGVNLADAHAGRLEDLDRRDEELFPASFVKVTCLITIHGYRVYRQVKNIQRVRRGVPVPIPRHKVVRCIADAMFAFLNQAQAADDHDWTFTLGPGGIGMEHLYLTELRRHGKTLVPVFGYIAPDADPAVLQPEIDTWVNDPFVMTFDTNDSGL
ncbi:uncharacterized protein PHACADRAFT_258706 [Phanerochaete carnosa HHB-10118-sp]|uniref:Uncharacterized protein n=1 Tax=Phanerochaete carnosa (strain HHB-10118-sp) TaxID=650164 RepID=K5WW56_PHACS|nr:uncharacterized protein PHACADRAFT_258706 [Phanerochaete carnosa HHB-10118-sp]EKM54692.1 hypothetical protein PHACADRAFT_258706 [Phanerochaete carnosa HHB-10118-sp]